MLSKNEIKIIKSLHQKKFRDETGMFIVEGPKLCEELNHSDFVTDRVIAIKSYNGELDRASEQFEKLINPLITQVEHRSFKISIANDYLKRPGEIEEIIKLKTNVVKDYHENIFINPLDTSDIQKIKKGRTTLYRVRAGKFSTKYYARRLQRRLRRDGFSAKIIVE